ncbi:isochorismatase family protein [Consotaella aegiceratis]|uniref:isochorismatase family protein n=1 Tax=Consotaella aegiceratis TaxID=3097961 RepID=UPI002F3F1E4B
MTVTALDPNSALIVIDLQKGIVSRAPADLIGDVLKNAAALAAAFRAHDLPVVLVNVAGGAPGRTETSLAGGTPPPDWTDLAPELDRQPADHLVTKRTWGAFVNTNLEAYLKAKDVTQVVIAGVATSIGVESTARQAYELGFNVTLAVDAMTDMSADAHANSVTRIFPRIGETGTSSEIADLIRRSR